MNKMSDLKGDNFAPNNDFNIKKEFFKYLAFWKYFALLISFFIICSFFYLRYTNQVFVTSAKIKILDKKENNLKLPSAADLFKNSKINLSNEIEVINSFPIIEKVASSLDLTTEVKSIGNVMESLEVDYPFKITYNNNKIISGSKYKLTLNEQGLEILDVNSDKAFFFEKFTTLNSTHKLPFEISSLNKSKWITSENNSYLISFLNKKNLILNLKSTLISQTIGRESDIISLSFSSTNPKYSENFLNKLIDVFNKDGINDRQLIHKRTVDFVNNRYALLSLELDSIEIKKRNFKRDNDLVDISLNSAISLEKSQKNQEKLFAIENQISVVEMLKNSLEDNIFNLLPSNIGIESMEINSLISSYNLLILERNKIILSAGSNNPSILQIEKNIFDYKSNIIISLKSFVDQQNEIKSKLFSQSNKFNFEVSNIPQSEKILRSIERSQKIKESLYLFLLQKREEAEVSYAVTEPSIKVVEYAITKNKPISPIGNTLYFIALIAGLFIPFIIIYLIFYFDNKIYSRDDIENHNSDINILGEIPFFDLDDQEKVFKDSSDRSIISESFRMLMSNVRYLENSNTKSNLIIVTSSIKGEGKTLNALNLALGFSSVGKKVLLIGCDLRNPQIHKYIDVDKNTAGLVDYLADIKKDWKKSIIRPFKNNQDLDLLLSGPLPPNPLHLINNGNIEILLSEAKSIYDYIIIDSAPTLLVADTKSLFNLVDSVLFLVRCNVTEIDILNHIAKVSNEIKPNVGVILNGVGQKNAYGYSYGYSYGYGYSYKYSYNYGYGYGYEEDKD